MKNKIQAALGLFYDHSFKKVMLIIALYFLLSLSFAFYMFKTNSLQGIETMSEFLNSPYFRTFSKIAFLFIFFFTVRGSGIMLHKNNSITNRIKISQNKMKFITLLYFIFIMLISYAALLITQYAIIKLHLFFYDYAFYNKLHIFGTIINNHFLEKIIPVYSYTGYIIRFLALIAIELFVVTYQAESKSPIILDIAFALLISIFFI